MSYDNPYKVTKDGLVRASDVIDRLNEVYRYARDGLDKVYVKLADENRALRKELARLERKLDEETRMRRAGLLERPRRGR
jgi:regulator of replication initiation timing